MPHIRCAFADGFVSEIRNHIYDLALEHIWFDCVRLVYKKRQPQRHDLNIAPGDTLDWSGQSRSFLGLTQASRQLRDEFRPLHQHNYFLTIELPDMMRYIYTFIPKAISSPAEADGNAVVAITGNGRYRLDPLMRICSHSPNINFDIFSNVMEMQHFKALLYPSTLKYSRTHNPTWWSYFNERVDRVQMIVKNEDVKTIRVYVKPRFAEAWMLGYLPEDRRIPVCATAKAQWQKDIGLGFLRHRLEVHMQRK